MKTTTEARYENDDRSHDKDKVAMTTMTPTANTMVNTATMMTASSNVDVVIACTLLFPSLRELLRLHCCI